MSEINLSDGESGGGETTNIPSENRRADARWTRGVLKHGFTIVPALMITNQDKLALSPEHFNVLLHLIYHWRNSEEDPYPTKKRLARLMGKSEKQVQRYLRDLEEKGFLRRIMRYKTGRGQTSSGYDLTGLVNRLRDISSDMSGKL